MGTPTFQLDKISLQKYNIKRGTYIVKERENLITLEKLNFFFIQIDNPVQSRD